MSRSNKNSSLFFNYCCAIFHFLHSIVGDGRRLRFSMSRLLFGNAVDDHLAEWGSWIFRSVISCFVLASPTHMSSCKVVQKELRSSPIEINQFTNQLIKLSDDDKYKMYTFKLTVSHVFIRTILARADSFQLKTIWGDLSWISASKTRWYQHETATTWLAYKKSATWYTTTTL